VRDILIFFIFEGGFQVLSGDSDGLLLGSSLDDE